MRRAYEILRDPTDRYMVWDLVEDEPVFSSDRIATFPALGETHDFLDVLKDGSVGPVAGPREALSAGADSNVVPLPVFHR
jgi:hypothetical protein